LLSFGLKTLELASQDNREGFIFDKDSLSFGLLASGLSVLVVGVLYILRALGFISPNEISFLGTIKDSHSKMSPNSTSSNKNRIGSGAIDI